jgi:hypothetical protein
VRTIFFGQIVRDKRTDEIHLSTDFAGRPQAMPSRAGKIYLRATFICGQNLFAGKIYLRAKFICGQNLFAGKIYLRAKFICGQNRFRQ